MKKQLVVIGSIASLVSVGIFSVSNVFAAQSLGTVTGRDGDVLEKVKINAEVLTVEGSQVNIKDTETGQTYDTSFGPKWYSKSYEPGERVVVEGVLVKGENEKGHNLQTMKVNDMELREQFEGKPKWAGQGGRGNGVGRHNREGFVDADGDGRCDNMN